MVAAAPKRDTTPLDDEQKAHIWVLFEEGRSMRETARQAGVATVTVQRVLRGDPGRLEALVALQRDERRLAWRNIENHALRELDAAIRTAHAALYEDAETYVPKRALTDLDQAHLAAVPRVGNWLGRIAADSARHHELLAGGPTERREHTGGLELGVLTATDDEIIGQAKELGLIPLLPARLREKLEALG